MASSVSHKQTNAVSLRAALFGSRRSEDDEDDKEVTAGSSFSKPLTQPLITETVAEKSKQLASTLDTARVVNDIVQGQAASGVSVTDAKNIPQQMQAILYPVISLVEYLRTAQRQGTELSELSGEAETKDPKSKVA